MRLPEGNRRSGVAWPSVTESVVYLILSYLISVYGFNDLINEYGTLYRYLYVPYDDTQSASRALLGNGQCCVRCN